jgi:hypothetical protein
VTDVVDIWHPDHPGVTSRVSRNAYERRSAKLGWLLAGDQPAAPEAPPVDEKADLTARLEAASVTVDRRWGVKRLRAEVLALEDQV